ncbi:MAG: TolC family outer membrane protein [Acetobacteraceae bacterium]
MGLRHGLMLSLGVGIVTTPLLAQTPLGTAAPPPASTLAEARKAQAARAQQTANKPRMVITTPPTPLGGSTVPRTLADALAATYSTQPALLAARARLRATDENVPQALAGWRPTVILQGTAGGGNGTSRGYSTSIGNVLVGNNSRPIATVQATLTQNLYTGGRVQANVNRSKNQVMAERANLMQQEQTSFLNTVNAYLGVIQAAQILALNINNEQVLAKQLQATNDRFRVGEITRTDVAQAEAALAGATAQRETAAGNLQTARGSFQQVVGFLPPEDLIEPQPLSVPVRSEAEAKAMAFANNPAVILSAFNNAAAQDAVDIAAAALLPQVSLQGQTFQQNNVSSPRTQGVGYQVVAQVSVPVYQGGSEYAAVRQARQNQQQTQQLVDDARRTAVQSAVQSWQTLSAARAAADSTRAQIRANEIALEGVQREAIVGSRTTLDVLNAQQTLLNSRTSLVQNLTQLVTASYQVAAAVGRLSARDLHLAVPLYDATAYYQAVKDRWVGLGDYATEQPGR